jgi:hypothetical protein
MKPDIFGQDGRLIPPRDENSRTQEFGFDSDPDGKFFDIFAIFVPEISARNDHKDDDRPDDSFFGYPWTHASPLIGYLDFRPFSIVTLFHF